MSRLSPDRFFDPDPTVRSYARELYEEVKDLPILSPHGHTDPSWFSRNEAFKDPASLLIIPDHYIFRILYSQGISLDDLGIPRRDGSRVEQDPQKIWQIFADNYYLFAGTPVAAWFDHVLCEIFGIDEVLDSKTGMWIYSAIDEQLKKVDFLPRNILDRFNIELLSTTDDASDELAHHQIIRDSDWDGNIIPTFRPDKVTNLQHPEWKQNIEALGQMAGREIDSYAKYILALEERRNYFKEMGAVATDHGVQSPYTAELSAGEAENLFSKALSSDIKAREAALFDAHMLLEMARMSVDDGLVMQLHPGSFRNHNQWIFESYGADIGADIPLQTEYTKNLHALLNRYGNDTQFQLIVFTLDETSYSRELAPLAGHYPALKLGPAWWFNDSFEGMMRFRKMTTETASIYNTAGFNDDTRALLSIPARHDLSRRVDSNYLATLVATHRIDMKTARNMSRALAYDLAKSTYKL